MRTNGPSPKLIVAVITAILTYLGAQEVLDLPPAAVVTVQTVLVALGVYRAGPGDVAVNADDVNADPAFAGER